MIGWLRAPPAERGLLGATALRGASPWIVAIMSFSILIVASAGLTLGHAVASLGDAVAHRYTLAIPAGAGLDVAAARLRGISGVGAVNPVSEQQMRDTLGQWLGPAADSAELPVPALIDFDLRPGVTASAIERQMRSVAPDARLLAQGDTVAPLADSLGLLRWIALGLTLLLAAAAVAAVVLAGRAALDSHGPTIAILHNIGATDRQITGLIQRKIGFDTFIGSIAGAAIAGLVLLPLAAGMRWAGQMAGASLGPLDILLLTVIPFGLTAVATLFARLAILRRLRRTP